ncbi:MAG: LysR family transcriptional regulator [Pseudoclavibacter sp.]
MVPFTLRQLEYFVAVADAGTLRDAAAAMHVSESALAAGVAQLERQLDVTLTVRKKSQGVTLTSAGRAFVGEALRLLRDATSLHERTVGISGAVRGTVTLGCPESGAATLVPPILMRLREAHPGIDLQVTLAPHRSPLQAGLTAGTIDLAIMVLHNLPPGFSWVTLHSMPSLVMLSADHPLAALPSISVEMLADEPMILLDISPSVERAIETFRAIGVTPDVPYRSDNTELVRSFVGRGLGFAFQIQRPYGDKTAEGLPLTYRPLRGGYVESTIVAWPENSDLSPAAQVVLDTAIEVFRAGEGGGRSAALSGGSAPED